MHRQSLIRGVAWILLPLAAWIGYAVSASADDAIVTIQFLRSSSGHFQDGTSLLQPEVEAALTSLLPTARANTRNMGRHPLHQQTAQDLAENHAQVRAALSRLNDGDVLVLNTQFSGTKAGVNTAEGTPLVIEWGEFYRAFGLGSPPRLALAILIGCSGDSLGEALSDAQLEAMMQALHAQALIAAGPIVSAALCQEGLLHILGAVQDQEKPWPDAVFAGKPFRFLHSTTIHREQASLAELRFRARKLGEESLVTKLDPGRDLVEAVEDTPELVVPGMIVAPWHSRNQNLIDGWTPIRFEFQPRGKIKRLAFELIVQTIPSIPETDSFYVRAGEQDITLKQNFTDCVKPEPTTVQIDFDTAPLNEEQHKRVLEQAQRGLVRGVLQDDTFLKEARMIVDYETAPD